MKRVLLVLAFVACFCVAAQSHAQMCGTSYVGQAPGYYQGGYATTYALPQTYSVPQYGRYHSPQAHTQPYAQSGYYPVMNQVRSSRFPTYQSYRPVAPLTAAQQSYVGQGILGQPKAYVPGQPLRNLFRYLTP